MLYYHGALPVDYYYLVNRVLLLKETMINSVVDKFLFNMPGMKIILEAFCCTPGTVDSCAERLAEGKTLVSARFDPSILEGQNNFSSRLI